MKLHKLALGTAQFGLDYGLTSTGHPIPEAEINNILSFAHNHTIRVLDTATVYGEAEKILGKILSKNQYWRIITKIPASGAGTPVDRAELALKMSLQRLKTQSIYGLLLHNPADLCGDKGRELCALVNEWKAEGRIHKFGISAYEMSEIEDALSVCQIDLVQVPLNVFDQRLLCNGFLKRLKRRGVEVHARSVFLQGLLLMDADTLPVYLKAAREPLLRFHHYLADHELPPVVAALAFVKGIAEIDHVVVGVHSLEHLRESMEAWDNPCDIDFSTYACDLEEIVDPRKWGVSS